MTLLRTILLTVLLVMPPLAVFGAPVCPPAGIGVLFIRPFVPERGDEVKSIALYVEPGMGRITDVDGRRLPSLASSLTASAGDVAVAVHETRGDWVRIVYDSAGRKGWIHRRRFWDFRPWRALLPGSAATLAPGLRDPLTLLRGEPSGDAPPLLRIPPDREFRILQLRDDWARVSAGEGAEGWIRWRDPDGRLLVVLVPAAR